MKEAPKPNHNAKHGRASRKQNLRDFDVDGGCSIKSHREEMLWKRIKCWKEQRLVLFR